MDMQRTKDCLSYIIHKLPAQEATAQAPLHSCANGGQENGIYSREINVNDLSSGLYFVHLYSEDFSITKKLNKQ